MIIIQFKKPTKEMFLTWFNILDNLPYKEIPEETYYSKNKAIFKSYYERKKSGSPINKPGRPQVNFYSEEELKEENRKKRKEFYALNKEIEKKKNLTRYHNKKTTENMDEIIKMFKTMTDDELKVYLSNCNPDYYLYTLCLEEIRFRKKD